MKGIYLTQQAKEELEAKIAELKNVVEKYQECKNWMWFDTIGQLEAYKEILSSATILPVEESWDNAIDTHDVENAFVKHYPNGVIIKSKQ
jgi:hypothetical protein